MANVVLIGMPGCGKSTLGVLLAKALMMDFVDTDLIMQNQSGKPLQQMVDELGPEGFSKAEEDCICGLNLQNTVIATGGSVALEERAMEHLAKTSAIVFIKLTYETIESRLKNIATRGITLKKGQTLRDLYDYRQPFYHRWGQIVVEADGQDIEQSVQELISRLNKEPHTQAHLMRDLAALGVQPGDAVLMHSSFKSLGGMEGGAKGFFEAFMQLLGQDGTLVLPALSYESVTRENPHFDQRQTPSCIGYLPEYFRTQVDGVVRSLHPTHSCCALGKQADFLCSVHHLDRTPVGPHSPFARLPQVNGKILILGSHPDHNTTLHGVEETAEPEYVFDRSAPIVYTVTDADGRTAQVTHLRHGFHFADRYYEQRYARIMNLLDKTEMRTGKVLDADCVLMDARAVWQKGHEALLKDPLYFVEVMKG